MDLEAIAGKFEFFPLDCANEFVNGNCLKVEYILL